MRIAALGIIAVMRTELISVKEVVMWVSIRKRTTVHEVACCMLYVVLVVVAHIYPPVTGQRQTLTYWTIHTLFITTTTS